MKRTLTLCLTLLFTLLCAVTLSACGTKPPATERPSSLVIVRDGVCEYTIVYDADSLEARRQATTLRSTLRSLYGVSLTPVPDDETPIGEREILIGATNRPLSQQLLAKRPSTAAEEDLFYGYMTDKTSLALYGSSSVAWEKCWATLSPTCLKETVFTVLPLCDNTRYMTRADYEQELEELRAEEEAKQAEEERRRAAELCQTIALMDNTLFGEESITVMPSDLYAAPSVYPTKGEHPRLLFTAEDIPSILEALEREDCAEAYAAFLAAARSSEDGKLPARRLSANGRYNSNFDAEVLSVIQSKALYYVLYGNVLRGYEAVYAIKNYLSTLDIGFYDSDVCRYYGYTMYITALVYDWCYDLLTPTDKAQLLRGVEHLLCRGVTSENGESKTEVGFPPTGGTGPVEGHGAEMALLRDFLSIAIAVYDEEPSWYELIGGRIFEQYIPIRNYFYESGIYPEGTACYAPWRFLGDLWCAWMLQSSTGQNPFNDDMQQVARSFLTHETADGGLLATGDGNSSSFYETIGYCALVSAYLYDDSTARAGAAYIQSGVSVFRAGVAAINPAELLICSMGGTEAAEDRHEGLSTVLYNDGFYQQIIARQSFTSDRSPVILLQGAGRQTVGHSHENAGDFRIYYKGLLTGGDGVYDSYASSHHLYYNKATIAHNCLLIYNPAHKSELRGFYSGGQRIRQKTEDIQAFMTDPYYDTGRVLGVAYDTKADGGASYVYFSNDLTAAYDADTVDRVERHMLATFREGDMPLFLFVLDRIDTPQTNFQKTFLLQAVAEPTINGHTAVIDNGQGKLVLINLLGADTIVAHGGEDGADPDRFYISTQNKNLASEGGTAGGGDAYQAGRTNGPMWGKLELPVRLGNTSDFMLNVLYVTDSTYTTLLTPTLLSGDTYLGATVSGQTAVFLKDGEADGHLPLTFTVTGSEMDYYIGGLRTGRWSVAVDGTPIGEMTVRAGEQFLTFRAPSGTVTLTPIDVEAPVAPPPADSGTIVYQTGGGTLPAGAPTEFRYGEVTVLPTELSRGNDIFLGWYADAAHTERIYEIGADVTATRLTVYAAFARSLLVEEYSGETANAMSYDTVSYANCRYERVKEGENSYLRWVTDSCDPQIRWVGSYADVMDTDTAIAFTLTLGGDGTDPVMAANLYFRDKNRNVLRVFNVTEDGGVYLRRADNTLSDVCLGSLSGGATVTVRIVIDFQTGHRIAYAEDGTVLDKTEIRLPDGVASHEAWLADFTTERFAFHADSDGAMRVYGIRVDIGDPFAK